jgi:hypothetical protein
MIDAGEIALPEYDPNLESRDAAVVRIFDRMLKARGELGEA